MEKRLKEALRISEEAATLAKEFFRTASTLPVEEKSVGQLVTRADLAVESAIRNALHFSFPGESVLGEEFGGDITGTSWIIDPIDGTSNFINGLPFWGVALGHQTDGVPDLGVIILPQLHVSAAGAGRTLFYNGHSYMRNRATDPTVSIGHGTITRWAQEGDLFSKFNDAGIAIYNWRSSAVSLAYSAIGNISGHLQEQSKAWDVIPGAALCAAAGLDVRLGNDAEGQPWIKAAEDSVHTLIGDIWE